MTGGRRTFGPVVLLGLATGALAAVAGSRPWARLDAEGADHAVAVTALSGSAGEMPLSAALALVVLACWGVVLVTRGRVRRALLVLGVLAALGNLVTVVRGWSATVDPLRETVREVGSDAVVSHTGWYAAALVAGVLTVVPLVLGIRLVPSWPEMGRRYDAPATVPSTSPAGGTAATADPADQSSLDLWKALDEGHDPTA